MPSVIQPAEFFVVGGPVQPERPCYVEREADLRLEEALRAKRVCCVLGPLATGKSSLLHRAARTLRRAGTLAAIVDLKRIAEQGGETPDGSLRLVAERVAVELGLRVDVGAWWIAGEPGDDGRLVDFFWQVVLTNTTAPVAVLFDDVDAALSKPFAAELLDAVRACHARRSREPDFARLGFALAGSVSQRELEQWNASFAEAEVIEPEDFSAEQSYRLAVAFGAEQELAQALMDRIRAWTGGHPYLTQRVARGAARKGGRFEDVERVVREQLLAPDAAARDPVLAHARAWLGDPSRPARRASKLLRKIAAGGKAVEPSDAAIAERLWLSGTVHVDAEKHVRARNRIIKELVADGWLKEKSSAPKWLAAAAVLLVAVAAGGYWYTQRLPVADIETLTSTSASLRSLDEAYGRLRRLPGFEQRADELWLAALAGRSRAATTLAEAEAADARLREVPGQAEAADRLLGEFWVRRAVERAHAEQRDAAILLAQRAAGADPSAAAYLAELVADDYSTLERSLRLPSAPDYWHMSFADAALVLVDAQRQASRVSVTGNGGANASGASVEPLALTALVHSALTREIAVDAEGTAGDLELTLDVQHPAAAELFVTLTAPSGAAAAVAVPRTDGAAVEMLRLEAEPGSPLALLADEGLRGVWRLTIVDREPGNAGVFAGWGIRFGDTAARDVPPEAVPIPDPTRSGDVVVRAAAERAVVWPVSPGVVGTLALWNLATGKLEHDFTLPAAPREVALDPTGSRVLAATDRVLMLWNAADGALVARVGTDTGFVLPPVFSADGGYVAIAERVEGANPIYSVLRSADGTLVGTIEGAPEAEAWELGPGGRYVTLQGPETVIRVLETRRGAELRRLPHSHAVERLLHSNDGATLVTVDRAGAIASWPLALASAGLGRPLGRTVSAATVSASADGRRLAFTRDDGAVAVLDVIAGVELYRLRLPRSVPITRAQISPDGSQLVTQSGTALKLWRLPSKPVTPRTATVDDAPTAIALDRANDVVAIGLASGQLQIVPASGARSSLSFFGHRGAITAAAVNGARGLAATGGSDGIVRVWDLGSSAPTVVVAQLADAPVAIAALSSDGRYVASASGRTARIATVADGRVTAELPAEGAVTALAFAPDSARIAVGDATGAVVIAALAPEARARATARLDAAVTSLAFAPDGNRLAAADSEGAIALLSAGDARVEGAAHHWMQPIRWLDFSADGGSLLVATDAWLHALTATPLLAPTHSKLFVWPASSTAFTPKSATSAGFAGVDAGGVLTFGVVDLAAPPRAVTPDAIALLARDWSTALALRLNDNGDPIPFDP
ncbi:MAG TPA: AAA-like domain-containing protein [Gammaproteobacteria bacterium]|nr:AAA-like domain-containing protein [Gammaproteobacteria bacterium]